jgi:hypothetical protein
MGMITLSVAASLTLVSGAALAQDATGTIGIGSPPAATAPPPAIPLTAGAAPEIGGAPIQSDTGMSKVADDGVSTKSVGSVRCSTAARETDGTTTCVGITPSSGAKAKDRR